MRKKEKKLALHGAALAGCVFGLALFPSFIYVICKRGEEGVLERKSTPLLCSALVLRSCAPALVLPLLCSRSCAPALVLPLLCSALVLRSASPPPPSLLR